MLSDVRDGLVTAIVAWHPDRLHRQPRELEDFIDIIEASRTEIATVGTGAYDLSTPSGRLIARQLGSLARYESEHRSERIKRKHVELASVGKPSGPAFYGYRKTPGSFTIVPREAKVIREIAKRLLKGESMNSIAADLNARGIPAARGRQWNTTTVRKTITKPSIAGLRVHNGEHYTATWKPILDRHVWDRIQVLLSEQVSTVRGQDGKEHTRRRMKAQSRRYLLTSGLARCALCGAALIAQTRVNKQPIYTCPCEVTWRWWGHCHPCSRPREIGHPQNTERSN
jgi:DNA invertase Pin-like site-specific DNA recombinase